MRSAFYADVSPTALRALNYAPEVEALRKAGRRHTTSLGDVFSRVGPAYGTVFTRVDCESQYGERLLDQASSFATEPVPRVIRGDGLPRLEQQRISTWQVLIAGAGTLGEHEIFGRSMLADRRLAGSIVGPDTMALWPKEPGSNLNCYAYAFLCTTAGVRAVRSTAYGTKILRFRQPFIASLPIPLGTDAQVARVAALVRDTATQREAHAAHLREARALLERIPGFSEARAMCERRERRAIWWNAALPTLTGWTYASAGEAFASLAQRWSARLGDVVEANGIFNGHRFARGPCERPYGLPLLSQRDVFMMRPIPRRVVHPGVSDRLLIAQPFTLLAGGAGTLGEGELFGRVEMVGEDWASLGISEHLLRILPRREYACLAYAFLSSVVGFRLLRSTAVGTKILSLRPDLLRALPFPSVSEDLRRDFDRAVTSALHARAKATAAESEAVRIIEQEVLPAWLA